MTAAKLRGLGIQDEADLKGLGEERLRGLLGKHGGQLYRFTCSLLLLLSLSTLR